jgi:SAM-dependent methyltransferase
LLFQLSSAERSELVDEAVARQAGTAQHPLLQQLGTKRIEARALADEIPIPASEDREGYLADQDFDYWLFGLGDFLLLERLSGELGGPLDQNCTVLDFGCASGRLLRHLDSSRVDALGIDLGTHNVRWARMHLPARISVAQGTLVPTLPLADASVDVVFAGSVFTHIDEFEEAWLLELRRVLRTGGFALFTFHPSRLWEELRNPDHFLTQAILATTHSVDPPGITPVTQDVLDGPIPGDRVVFTSHSHPINNKNLLHSHEWIKERWGSIFGLRRIIECCHGGHQDGAVLVRTD